jgi:hypothetical protein
MKLFLIRFKRKHDMTWQTVKFTIGSSIIFCQQLFDAIRHGNTMHKMDASGRNNFGFL